MRGGWAAADFLTIEDAAKAIRTLPHVVAVSEKCAIVRRCCKWAHRR